jgi:hypothetical protein
MKRRAKKMAYTRQFIRNAAKESGVEIPKEFEDALINEHISVRDAFAEEKVKTALAENKPPEPVKVTETDEYKTLKRQFDDYKAEIEGKEALAAKEKAVKAYYEGKNITGDNLTIAMLSSGEVMKTLEMDGEKIKDTEALDALVGGALAKLVTTTTVTGANTETPPANSTGKDAFDALTLTEKMKFANEHPTEYATYTR